MKPLAFWGFLVWIKRILWEEMVNVIRLPYTDWLLTTVTISEFLYNFPQSERACVAQSTKEALRKPFIYQHFK